MFIKRRTLWNQSLNVTMPFCIISKLENLMRYNTPEWDVTFYGLGHKYRARENVHLNNYYCDFTLYFNFIKSFAWHTKSQQINSCFKSHLIDLKTCIRIPCLSRSALNRKQVKTRVKAVFIGWFVKKLKKQDLFNCFCQNHSLQKRNLH